MLDVGERHEKFIVEICKDDEASAFAVSQVLELVCGAQEIDTSFILRKVLNTL